VPKIQESKQSTSRKADAQYNPRKTITNFIQTITPGILDRFQQSKWPPKALKKIFQTVPETSQSDQYSLSYQQIS